MVDRTDDGTVAPPAPTTGSLRGSHLERAESVGALILHRQRQSGSDEAFRAPDADDVWQSHTWNDVISTATELAAGLMSLGLNPEDRVGIASNTRLEWILADYAIMLCGGATTTVYPTTGGDDVAFILADSNTRVLFAEDPTQVDKVLAHRDETPDLETFVLMDGHHEHEAVMTWEELRRLGREYLAGRPAAVTDRVGRTRSDDLATLIYTSGTTGRPKGVELTHGNWTYEAAAMSSLGMITDEDVHFLWLPLSHSFGKVLLSAHLAVGGVTAVDGRFSRIVDNLPVVRPTWMAAAPRIFEKMHARVTQQVQREGGVRASLFSWAFGVGFRARDLRATGVVPGLRVRAELAVADRLVFSRIRSRLGGNLRYFFSGSAALSPDIAAWFDVVGLPVLEGYGLTETSAATCVNRMDNRAVGTVGEPLSGTEVTIADDGEILVRGPGVMRGYRNRPEATREAFIVGNGWFATGDIGLIDDAGRVRVTDRKKDLVKTSGGKYIAPSAIEAQLKAVCPLAGAVVVVADGRNYATALVALDPDAAAEFAEHHALQDASLSSLADDPCVVQAVQDGIDDMNSRLNRWETIKQFRVLPVELTVEAGHLTPSLKVKRTVVQEEFGELVRAMYP